jgi:hypothetical protein
MILKPQKTLLFNLYKNGVLYVLTDEKYVACDEQNLLNYLHWKMPQYENGYRDMCVKFPCEVIW